MARKLLTQRFHFLIPVRLLQRKVFKGFVDSTKGYKYSKKYCEDKLRYRVFKHKSLLIRKLGDTDIQLQYNKILNLKLAASKINHVLIRPGETFSFWKLVEETSKKNGYKEGIFLLNGETRRGIGGGICQLGNLLYWMFLHTPLITIERYRHSYDPFPDYGRVIPFGTGATLANKIIDLKMKNETDITFQIIIWFDDDYIRGEILADKYPEYSYTVYEKDHKFIREKDGNVYRMNKVYRKSIDRATGNIVEDKIIIDNKCLVKYQVSETLIEKEMVN